MTFKDIFRRLSRTLSFNFQDFPGPKRFSRTFQVLEFSREKNPGLSRRRGNLVHTRQWRRPQACKSRPGRPSEQPTWSVELCRLPSAEPVLESSVPDSYDISLQQHLTNDNNTELRSVTCHMGSHSVTCRPTQALTPTMQVGTRFTYPGGMEGWVDLGGWLYTEMVYLSTDSHPSK